jgi:plastocyanin
MIKTTALVAAAALTLAACGSGSSYSSKTSSSTSTTSKAAAAGPAATSTTKVEMYDNYFQPKTITGKAGSTVKIKLENVGQRDHNFKIDAQKQANADVGPGKSASVSVKIPASGTVQFYCEYHKGLGMVGTVKPS